MTTEAFYESDKALNEYLHFHYGEEETLPFGFGPKDALGYPVRCIRDCFSTENLNAHSRALDLGCAVGRSSFELARHAGSVLGIDFSHRFIGAASSLKKDGRMPYQFLEEGCQWTQTEAIIDPTIDRHRIEFQQGDACNLPDSLGCFDAVLMANLIDRLPNPGVCLERLAGLINKGGQLVITSPYTWLEEYTPKNLWIGGPEHQTTEGLKDILGPEFALLEQKNLPFLIREHRRKYQWSVAEATIWKRL